MVIQKKNKWSFDLLFLATSCNLLWPSSEAWRCWTSTLGHQQDRSAKQLQNTKKDNFGMKWKFPLSVFISTFLKMKHNAWMNFSRSTLARKKGTKVFTLSKGTPCVPSLPLKGAYWWLIELDRRFSADTGLLQTYRSLKPCPCKLYILKSNQQLMHRTKSLAFLFLFW